jgi:nucleotide-binding universal stress UspA family protein
MQKQEAQSYLDRVAGRLQKTGTQVEALLLEGNPAEAIIEFARNNAVDLIALSSHGRTGLSGWNVSSVVQKILMRSYRSILLVRAYDMSPEEVTYKRLFLAVDGSTRAEFILPFAMTLAQVHHSSVILGTVIYKPHTIQRFPLSAEEHEFINQFTDKNQKDVEHYFDQLAQQFSLKELSIESNIRTDENILGAIYDMIDDTRADLVMLAAHGHSGDRRWPYGSIASSLIAYGHTPLMILQDLPEHEVPPTHAERAIREGRGR